MSSASVGVRGAIVVGGLALFAGSLPYLAARIWRVKTIDQVEERDVADNKRPEGTSESDGPLSEGRASRLNS